MRAPRHRIFLLARPGRTARAGLFRENFGPAPRWKGPKTRSRPPHRRPARDIWRVFFPTWICPSFSKQRETNAWRHERSAAAMRSSVAESGRRRPAGGRVEQRRRAHHDFREAHKPWTRRIHDRTCVLKCQEGRGTGIESLEIRRKPLSSLAFVLYFGTF